MKKCDFYREKEISLNPTSRLKTFWQKKQKFMYPRRLLRKLSVLNYIFIAPPLKISSDAKCKLNIWCQ
jgi:hypothetical protein